MAAYLQFVKIHGEAPHDVLHLAYPKEGAGTGCINVICGLNTAGKTFLLERIRKIVQDGRNAGHYGVTATLTSQEPPRLLFFGKSWREKTRAGIINVGMAQPRLKLPGDVPDYRRVALQFLLSQLNRHLPAQLQVTPDVWLTDMSARTRAASHFECETELYLCDREDPTIQLLERLLEATLYVRRAQAEQFDLSLVYGDGSKVPYSEWSDGQQACFYLVLLVTLCKPNIVLLDEIENHLHPAYITRILELLKSRVPQSVVTTHHPHVIFSGLVDRVHYLEIQLPRKMTQPPDRLPYEKHQYQKVPTRAVVTLEDEFDKVTHAYKLFDLQDAQLLKQAARITSEADILLYGTLSAIFRNDLAKAKAGPLPDKQSQQLADAIKDFILVRPGQHMVTVLDLGAGLGRVAQETAKLSEWQVGASIGWICWEPDPAKRGALSELLKQRSIKAVVPDAVSAIGTESTDLCLFANVLHEVTPQEFAELLCLAERCVDHTAGGIIIEEIYPLLHAEKYAVPYPETELLSILLDCGFNAYSRSVGVHGGVANAYCLFVRKRQGAPASSPGDLREAVEKGWERLEKYALAAYSNRRSMHSMTDYQSLTQELTTIASIAAWRKGQWTPRNWH